MPLEPTASGVQLSAESSETDFNHHRIASMPILLLHVHEHCNCRCMMCDIWQRKDGKELDLVDFARHRLSILRLGVREVVLTGGEPLLHPELEVLCSFLRSCGVRLTLLTTGLLLLKHADLVATWIDEIIISLDGPEETHDLIRRVKGGYRLIADGIQAIRQRRPGMTIRGRCTVQNANCGHLRQTVESARNLSLNSISFLAVDVTSQAFNRSLVWPLERQARVALMPDELLKIEREIDSLIRDYRDDIDSGFITESPEKLWRIHRRFQEQLGGITPIAPQCNAPWVSAVIEVDGSVRPCFFHEKIGSTQTLTLEQVINGDAALRFRASLNIAENPTCRRCVCSLNYRGHSIR